MDLDASPAKNPKSKMLGTMAVAEPFKICIKQL